MCGMGTPLSTLNVIIGKKVKARLEKLWTKFLQWATVGDKKMGVKVWVLVFSMMLSR
jgi:hypothetical protein